MRRENCATRNHITVWHERVLPAAPERVTFPTVVRGSCLPLLVWAGVAGFACVVHEPGVTFALGGLFVLSFVLGYGLRRRARHTVRCSAYGAMGGVFDKSMDGF
ncbi:hypothetical protein [Streptomyces sp. NPDC008125]|uniref:hypothetical protein n=1 Tax=Streptomyces sp. NPDC008125 TaxID=3364811 RepID=UPI0036E9E197